MSDPLSTLAGLVRIALRAVGADALGEVRVDPDIEGIAVGGSPGEQGSYLLAPTTVEVPSIGGARTVTAYQVHRPRVSPATRYHPEEWYEVPLGEPETRLSEAATQLVLAMLREQIEIAFEATPSEAHCTPDPDEP